MKHSLRGLVLTGICIHFAHTTAATATLSLSSIELHGDLYADGALSTTLLVGGASDSMTAIVDTGSSGLALRCGLRSVTLVNAGCTGEDLSSGACDECSIDKCIFTKSFSEGSSIRGYNVRGTVSFKHAGASVIESSLAHTPIGCITEETGAFKDQSASGILGLAQGKHGFLAAHLSGTPGSLVRNSFALCVRPDGGWLTLGVGSLRPLPPLSIQRSDMYIGKHNGYYLAKLSGVAVGSIDVEAAAGDSSSLRGAGTLLWLSAVGSGKGEKGGLLTVVLDSGSTFSYVPRDVLVAVMMAVRSFCEAANALHTPCMGDFVAESNLPKQQSMCIRVPTPTEGAIETWPGVSLRFEGGALWHIPARFAFHSTPWTSGLHCLGLFPSDESGGRSVLGLNALAGHDVTFDVQGEILSWSPSGCETGSGGPTGELADTDAAVQSSIQSLNAVAQSLGRQTGAKNSPWASGSVLVVIGISLGFLLVLTVVASGRAYSQWKLASGISYAALRTTEKALPGSCRQGAGAPLPCADSDSEDEDRLGFRSTGNAPVAHGEDEVTIRLDGAGSEADEEVDLHPRTRSSASAPKQSVGRQRRSA